MTLPDQSTTTRLCELMELAAARQMRPHLQAGESSVAVTMSLRHIALGRGSSGVVRVSAGHHVIAGRLHHFIVNAFDERGLIAVCEHTRAIVNGRHFLANSRGRAGHHSILLEN